MPSHPAPYQRTLFNGVPYWKDTDGNLYLYESAAHPTPETRICLGTESTGLFADWQTRLAPRLAQYRTTQKPRGRAAAAPAASKIERVAPAST